MSDLTQFKTDYPEVHDKMLEMNRALAKLQRALVAGRQQGKSPSVEQIIEEVDEFPDFLELE